MFISNGIYKLIKLSNLKVMYLGVIRTLFFQTKILIFVIKLKMCITKKNIFFTNLKFRKTPFFKVKKFSVAFVFFSINAFLLNFISHKFKNLVTNIHLYFKKKIKVKL